jgi:hypothetical protein
MTDEEFEALKAKHSNSVLTGESLDAIGECIVDTIDEALESRDQRISQLEQLVSMLIDELASLRVSP